MPRLLAQSAVFALALPLGMWVIFGVVTYTIGGMPPAIVEPGLDELQRAFPIFSALAAMSAFIGCWRAARVGRSVSLARCAGGGFVTAAALMWLAASFGRDHSAAAGAVAMLMLIGLPGVWTRYVASRPIEALEPAVQRQR